MNNRVILLMILLLIVVLLFFLLRTYTPAIKDAQGKIIPNSIASIEQVEINNTKQWIVLRGENKDNPVLLWVDGGPGGTVNTWGNGLIKRKYTWSDTPGDQLSA